MTQENKPVETNDEVLSLDIILASGSPRRKQLLEDAGVAFRVYTPQEEVDETIDDDLRSDPAEAAKKIAERKAGAVVQEVLADPAYAGQAVIIAADTMVVYRGSIFGKPANISDATGMLRKLSGDTHQVITGVSVWMVMVPADDPEKISMGYRTFTETSHVTFKDLSDEEIATYLAKGESFDKAGAYAIQGEGAALVEGYSGDYDNIVGLPVTKLLDSFPDLR